MKLNLFEGLRLKKEKQKTFEELVNEIVAKVNNSIGIEYSEDIKKQIKECKMEGEYFRSKETEFVLALNARGIEHLANFSLPKGIEPDRKDYFVLRENEMNKEKVREFRKKYGI